MVGTTVIVESVSGWMRDVAGVRFSFEDETSRSRLYDFTTPDGENSISRYAEPRKSVSMEIMKKDGENILAVTESVRKVVQGFALPDEVRVVVVRARVEPDLGLRELR